MCHNMNAQLVVTALVASQTHASSLCALCEATQSLVVQHGVDLVVVAAFIHVYEQLVQAVLAVCERVQGYTVLGRLVCAWLQK
jgi:hypothetical protein